MVSAYISPVESETSIEVIGYLCLDIGKDVLEARLAVGMASGKAFAEVPNSYKGWQKLKKEAKLAGITKLYVTMEATGSHWKKVAQYFYDQEATVFVVNPACIKAQRRTELRRSKTDRIDAKLILNFTRAQLSNLRPWSPPSAAVSELQSLVRYRDSRVGERITLKNQIGSGSACPRVLRFAKGTLKRIEEEIKELEEAILAVLDSDEELKKQSKNADSVSGIGLIAAATLLAECRAFKEIRTPRQATAFAGLDVVEDSSATIVKPPHISRKGSSLLRKTFVNCAAAAKRAKDGGAFRKFYDRLRAKGMKKKPALVATGRKLLEVTVAVVLSETKFDPTRNV